MSTANAPKETSYRFDAKAGQSVEGVSLSKWTPDRPDQVKKGDISSKIETAQATIGG